jgi:hypothetical protein
MGIALGYPVNFGEKVDSEIRLHSGWPLGGTAKLTLRCT